jgi:D-alanine-D-alanine ligase
MDSSHLPGSDIPGHVLILAGGLAFEREVSLNSGRRVDVALKSIGVQSQIYDLDNRFMERIEADPPTAIFSALHGPPGEDGSIADLLNLTAIPYVGSPPDACRLSFDKAVAKAEIRRLKLSTPRYIALPHEMFREVGPAKLLDLIVECLGLPIVVKPARGGSALGLSIVHAARDLPSAMVRCLNYGDVALLEQFIDGRELAVTVIDVGKGPVALPPIEIKTVTGTYDYSAHYTAGLTRFVAQPSMPGDTIDHAVNMALLAHKELGLRYLSRTDIIVNKEGEPHFLEVTGSPGLTDTSAVLVAIEEAGLTMANVCHDLVVAALSTHDQNSRNC